MSERDVMVVNGHGAEAVLLKILKTVGIEQGKKDRIFVRPALLGWESKGPTKRRKYAQLTLKLGLSSELFREPGSINYIDPGVVGNDLMMFMSIDKTRFNSEGLLLAQESDENNKALFAQHPELAGLLDDFLPRWKEAYARALAAGKEE